MSLLLQALKKAEEEKRRRAAVMSDQVAESSASAVEFPALNLAEDEDSATESPIQAQPDMARTEASDWDFVPLDVAAVETDSKAVVQTGLATVPLIEIDNPDDIHSSDPPPDVAAVQPSITAVMIEPAANASELERVEQPPPEMSTTATPSENVSAKSSLPAQDVAKNLFTKSKKPPARALLPWLFLGAGILLAGMVAWFTWQYRQLTQPNTLVEVRESIAPLPSSVASEPMYISEETIEKDLHANTPVIKEDVHISKPVEKSTSPTPEKITVTPTLAAKAIPDRRDLNPPLKFVRESPHFNAPDPLLMAWQFYQSGDLNQAELHYQKALQADPRQRDALLGLAAIAQQRGDLVVAAALYQRLLRANPQDESAQAALLMLNSAQLPEHEAVQLEQSGKSDPMVLGQYFAAQQRWSQAQEQFFLAYSANPNSADAALNLAVSLDHLKQTSLAKTYYRKALQTKGSINFDRSIVEQRLVELDAAAGVAP